jgi:hypothetical protein
MSINHLLTNGAGVAQNITVNKCEASEVTAKTCFSTEYPQSASDITIYGAQYRYTLGGLEPPLFVSEVAGTHTLHLEEKKAFNVDDNVYKYTLCIKGTFSLKVDIVPAPAPCEYIMTIDGIDPRYLASRVIFKTGKAINILFSGQVLSTDIPYLVSVFTGASGLVQIQFKSNSHALLLTNTFLQNDFSIELVAT